MYLRMKVGAYQGEVRGPFTVDIARNLIATGQAVEVKNNDGLIAEPEPELAVVQSGSPEPVAEPPAHRHKGRK
jgi:hypothetical protein